MSERERDSHPLFNFSNEYNGQDWTRPVTQSRLLLPFRVYIRERVWNKNSNPGPLTWDVGCLTSVLTTKPKVHLQSTSFSLNYVLVLGNLVWRSGTNKKTNCSAIFLGKKSI